MKGFVVERLALLSVVVFGFGLHSPAYAQSAGTDMIGKPGSWRGTLLEGTDAVIATNKYGEPLFVESGDTVSPIFEPAPVTAKRLVNEFKKLCIDTGYDETKLAVQAPQSSFALGNRRLTIPSPKGASSYEASVWHSPEARVQIWSGQVSSLNSRQTLSRWRNGATVSPFKDTRMFAPACNVTVMATGFDGPQPFVAAMNEVLSTQPAKSVIKNQWADGHWMITGADGRQTQLFYNFVDLDKSEQLLHVAITPILPKKAK